MERFRRRIGSKGSYTREASMQPCGYVLRRTAKAMKRKEARQTVLPGLHAAGVDAPTRRGSAGFGVWPAILGGGAERSVRVRRFRSGNRLTFDFPFGRGLDPGNLESRAADPGFHSPTEFQDP
jgi:hypothetical protein